ncbi:LuxR C-terminal-related transcriptional regulator [Pseudomonas sp. WJP1]|uniref:helix-turn-helix transcriptional regulator n=1 Tax=Pseudomonas sp. WJP1 TaxID=2986947 RepID=UPI00234BDB8D|nr:LuxR C-terminal-related transcriptional regulator [Pseudomonas sp. WJP1]WCM48648.1 LuxR C-terminal-related transcriptional regulator [Pseudomonas sp. WJP1]
MTKSESHEYPPAATIDCVLDKQRNLQRFYCNSQQTRAPDINISLETVKWNLKNIYAKLGVSSRYDAVSWARKNGLIE